MDTFGTSELWVGANDEATDGTYVWENGVTFEYNHFKQWDDNGKCNIPVSGSKTCVYLKGSWSKRMFHSTCQAQYNFVCQKGVSSSKFWNRIHGADYAHFERPGCRPDWEDAKTVCEGYGAKLASVLSQEVLDELLNVFSDSITTDMFLGLNDKSNEGTFVWEKGEAFAWSNWKNNHPKDDSSKNCVKMKTNGEWQDVSCSEIQSGVLCMKGTSTSVGASSTSSGSSTGVLGTVSSGRYSSSDCTKRTITSGSAITDINQCCSQCLSEEDDTNAISFKNNNECRCVDKDDDDCGNPSTSSGGNAYDSADCNSSKKRKRSINKVFPNVTSSVVRRDRRSTIDTSMVRKVTCNPLWDDTTGYWSYEYTVPSYCYSK